ncbi:MBL fold metallo-hydrolase [Niastella populi]|uniref:Polyketide synthase n=1 Tax=Niastella populi TaxID=550983 RepID=A0A1V9EK24_9BACT|nr:MBL fold metallo-hydrolase [Niastella populi]OQP46205.1 polyketide synthase [Niastella populi]
MEIQDNDLVYVRQNLAIEPLVDNWYAWSHLVSPATAALNIKERHLKIMNSYIQNPHIHAAAVKNPKMLGGPFIDYDGKRLPEIEELKNNTMNKCSELLELCDSITDLNRLLTKEAKGFSLASLYPKVPDNLRGYVELFYDLNNTPSYRFFELLLYKSKYYKEELQSVNLFLVNDDDSRSFVLSTPKLVNENILRLHIPFKDKRIDEFFACVDTPRTFGELKKLMNISPDKEALFKTFFTIEAPQPYKRYSGDGVLTRYFGHACILVETKDTAILVDPVISYGYESDISRFTYNDLPETIDYVLFTHNHQDHILFETLLRIRRKIKHIVVPRSNGGSLQDPNLRLMFSQIGFDNIIELGDMEKIELSDCVITGLPFLGEHADLDIRTKLCHMVECKNGYKIIFAADSCNVETRVYEKIHEIVGDVDIMFLGMECDGAPLSWLYGPLMPEQLERDKDQSRRLAGCNFEQSKELIDIFKPSDVFIYAMGMEPWLKFISSIKYTDESRPIIESNKVLDYCKAKGLEAERLFGEKIIEY